MIIFISFLAFIAILIGGSVALKLKDKFHLVLGFSAGAVLGVAFFDLIPEAFEIGSEFFDIHTIALFIAIGFVGYLLLDRLVFFHSHQHSAHDAPNVEDESLHAVHGNSPHPKRGILGASSLILHTFFDGMAIGLAFQVSVEIGIIVSVGIIIHGFSDGLNTVGIILKNQGSRKTAIKFLALDAVAPVLGAFSTLFFTIPEQNLGIMLAVFGGFFLYIGASDLIPESHHAHPKFLTTAMTIVGMAVIFIAISIAHA